MIRIFYWLLSTWLAPAFGLFVVAAADTAAGSAPATDAPATPAGETPQTPFSENDFQAYKESENREALDRAEGKEPAKKPAKDSPTPGDSATPPAETAADSAAASAQKKGKTKEDTEHRFKELSDNYGAAKRRIEELERRLTPPATAPPAKEPGSQPAAAAATADTAKPEPKIDDVNGQGQPKYKTLAEYMAARETWLEDKLVARLKADSAKEQQDRSQQEQAQIINKGWNDKVEPARKKYTDFDTVALNPDLPIKAGSVPDAFVLDSEHGADVLYYLGQHPDVLDSINKMNPLRQARELFAIEQKLAKPATSATRVTRAPAPPHEVAGQGTVPPDEVEQALADDDFQAYKAAENRKAIALAKGR